MRLRWRRLAAVNASSTPLCGLFSAATEFQDEVGLAVIRPYRHYVPFQDAAEFISHHGLASRAVPPSAISHKVNVSHQASKMMPDILPIVAAPFPRLYLAWLPAAVSTNSLSPLRLSYDIAHRATIDR